MVSELSGSGCCLRGSSITTRCDLRRLLYDVDDESLSEDSNAYAGSDGEAGSLEPAALYSQILMGSNQ